METAAKKVIVIEPTKGTEKVKKIRVAAYCRVSTDSDDQLNSFFAQMKYYTDYIRKNPNMELVDIYADEGITGTVISKRDEFKRLIKDCKNGKIDRVLVKSVTRFARNSLECVETVRSLRSYGATVYCENDNIDSETMNSEMILYIKSAFAQGEAISASKRMSTSIRMKMENGTYFNSSVPFGYKLDGRQLVVDEEKAEIVKEIYALYLEGKGFTTISNILHAKGWTLDRNSVYYILTNEKYIGDTLWQKYYTPDVFPFVSKRNYGELPKYYCKETQEPIISKEDFYKVKEIQKVRTEKYYKKPTREKFLFDNCIYCKKCGWKYKHRKKGNGLFWLCSKKDRTFEKCNAPNYSDTEIRNAFANLCSVLREYTEELLGETILQLQTLKSNLSGENAEIKTIDEELLYLGEQNSVYTKMYANGVITESLYREKAGYIQGRMTELRGRRTKIINEDDNEACIEKIRKLKRIIGEHNKDSVGFDEELFTSTVEKIYVEQNGSLVFCLIGELKFRIDYEDIKQ